jgi:acetylornithine deacetylase/succinyl-diaminopimelate desuccinylase-like protein
VEFLKEQCKALFFFVSITNKGTAYNVVGYVEGIDLKKRVLLISGHYDHIKLKRD